MRRRRSRRRAIPTRVRPRPLRRGDRILVRTGDAGSITIAAREITLPPEVLRPNSWPQDFALDHSFDMAGAPVAGLIAPQRPTPDDKKGGLDLGRVLGPAQPAHVGVAAHDARGGAGGVEQDGVEGPAVPPGRRVDLGAVRVPGAALTLRLRWPDARRLTQRSPKRAPASRPRRSP